MATPAQTFANRENSRHSTGPRTPEGKSASSQNSKTHGFNAGDPVLPAEDRARFNEFLEQFRATFAPVTINDESLVHEIAAARWKLNRLERIETEMFAALADPSLAFTDKETAAGFIRLDRYRTNLQRIYHRAVRELRAVRKEQNEANSTEMAETKFEKLLKRTMEAPPPGYTLKHKLVRVDPTAENGSSDATVEPAPSAGD